MTMPLTPLGPVSPIVPIPETRFSASESDLPYLPPPYESLLDGARTDSAIHLHHDQLKQAALHPIRLHAGKSPMPNGELGRHCAPGFFIPEVLGGYVLATHV